MDSPKQGRLGLGLKAETETLLGFGGLGIMVGIGAYTGCQILPDHSEMISAVGLMCISLLARAYKVEVKKDESQIVERKNEVVTVKNHIYTIKSQ